VAGTELKRYFITPNGWEEFLRILRRIAVVRQRHGFQILFTFADRELNLFTWAIRHVGDFDEAAQAYYKDPERIELEIVGDYITDFQIRRVEELQIP
jgi:hypothetical protein